MSSNKIDVALEIGKKRTFASAVEWPGWSRSGRGEADALQALFEQGPRYARALRGAGLGFEAPDDLSQLAVVERLEGSATTDFGAPGVAPSADARPVSDADLNLFRALLQACWKAFDVASAAAAGKELRKGPRGGGRDLQKIAQHVLGAEAGYLGSLGWKPGPRDAGSLREDLRRIRADVLEGLAAAAHGEIPAQGPRGSIRWSPRYFVRRLAWHVLDHTWEIEDRAEL